jgi:hypothetical protein
MYKPVMRFIMWAHTGALVLRTRLTFHRPAQRSGDCRRAVCIGNEDTAPTPTGFAEIVGDGFPVLHAGRILPLLLSTRQ